MVGVTKRLPSPTPIASPILEVQLASHGKTKEHFLHPKSKLVYCDRNFLTPSIQYIAAHLSPVKQTCQSQDPQTSNSSITPNRSSIVRVQSNSLIVLPISSPERW
jgi:hypothetical protein